MINPRQKLTSPLQSPIAFRAHNHNQCKAHHIEKIEEICLTHQLNLTTARKMVLEILLEDHRAIGAYTILKNLQDKGFKPQPPLVYRALDFLVANGFAHKIERLNAYVACTYPEHQHHPSFWLCRSCENVAETISSHNEDFVNLGAEPAQFHIEHVTLEAEGLCPDCQENMQK